MKRSKSILPAIFFILLIAAGGGLIWWGMNNNEPEPAPEPAVFFSPEDLDTYEGLSLEEAVLQAQRQLSDVDNGVAVPSLDLVSPMISTGQTGGWLELPDPPYSTLYNQAAPIGSPEGASVVASHVDYGHGEDAPFSVLHKIEKGTPVIIKSEGSLHVYTAEAIELFTRQGLPADMFRLDGDATAFLVTCSGPVIDDGSRRPFYENNLVVTGDLLGEATVIRNDVTIEFPAIEQQPS